MGGSFTSNVIAQLSPSIYYIFIQSTVIQIHTVNKRDPPPLVHLVVLNYARQEQTKSLARSLVYYCL